MSGLEEQLRLGAEVVRIQRNMVAFGLHPGPALQEAIKLTGFQVMVIDCASLEDLDDAIERAAQDALVDDVELPSLDDVWANLPWPPPEGFEAEVRYPA